MLGAVWFFFILWKQNFYSLPLEKRKEEMKRIRKKAIPAFIIMTIGVIIMVLSLIILAL